MFDPCGTRHLDGDEIIKRLAEALNITPLELRNALNMLIIKTMKQHEKL